MVNPHFSRWSHCFQPPVGWIAPCGVGCTGRGHVQCLQCRSTCQRGLRGDHWGLSQFKGPALMWEQNLKQSKTGVFLLYGMFFLLYGMLYDIPVFSCSFSSDVKAMVCFYADPFHSQALLTGYAAMHVLNVLWRILSLETNGPQNKQVQH